MESHKLLHNAGAIFISIDDNEHANLKLLYDCIFGEQNNQVFIWLTSGKGNLEEQSKEKIDRYIHGSQTKLLCDVMAGGFEENDCCFINWEKLTKKGNNALKDSERVNFGDYIFHVLEEGLTFKIFPDNLIKAYYEAMQGDGIDIEAVFSDFVGIQISGIATLFSFY